MVNKVILIGNLGKDPELTYTPNGAAVCKFSLATTEKWTNRDGQKQESTEWHNIVIWRRLAEVANEYLRKGSRIYVEGRIKTRSWDAQDGTKRYMTEIEAQNFQMLSNRGEMGGGGGGQQQQRPQQNQQYQQRPPAQQSPQQDNGYQYDYGQQQGGGQSGGGQPGGGGAPDQGFGADDSDLPF